MTYPFKKAIVQVCLKRDNSKPIFPCVVMTPDNRVAVYFAEKTAFISPEKTDGPIDGISAGLSTDAVHISRCRPVADGTHITFIA